VSIIRGSAFGRGGGAGFAVGLLALAGGAVAQVPAPPPAAAAVSSAPAVGAVAPVAPKAAKPLVAAKELFGAHRTAAPLEARAIGSYAKGCLSGAQQLAVDGPAWQAMRLSRNRNWGHPALIAIVQKLADDARAFDGWPGLLVGDISQPRGGPMLTGHASHQIGLDADIWLTPMPPRRLTAQEREDLSATSMLAADQLSVDPKLFTDGHLRLLKRASSITEVERVLVHPAIKKAICEATVKDQDRAWLRKVRPIWGHHYHFHVRIGCPQGAVGCLAQAATPGDDGCGKELDDWFVLLKRPPTPETAEPPKPPLTLDGLPAECRVVLNAGAAAQTK
jgi:penicillin-insensitive murein DD-endopeptidase